MERTKHQIQNELLRNASILSNWNDISNADLNELGERSF